MRKILILANGTDEISIVVPFSVATNGTSFKEGEGALANSSGFGISIDEARYNCTQFGIVPPGSPTPKGWKGVNNVASKLAQESLAIPLMSLVSLLFCA
jgi:hypothetical protein